MDALLKRFNEKRPDDSKAIRTTVDETIDDKNRFALPRGTRNYGVQYYHMYERRLKIMKERVRIECMKKWNDDFRLDGKPVVMKKKVLDIQGGQPCWAIGSIYCEMKYKPNILEEVIHDTYGAPDLTKSYTDGEGSDEIMLEDESGRVLLVGEYMRNLPLVTGIVVGILGMEAEPGTFQVLDICYPTSLPQLPMPNPGSHSNPKKIAFVSGLNVSSNSPGRLLKIQLLQEFLLGRVCNYPKVVDIGKLIILGNSVDTRMDEKGPGDMINCLNELGKFLSNILQSIPVDIMPGIRDPTDRSLPQQPLHKALFKDSIKPFFEEANRKLFNTVTNPYCFNFEGLRILAIAGQNIDDIYKYIIPYQESGETSENSQFDDNVGRRLDLMECTMTWQNLAPTAPDTLWAYPYKDEDPFLLTEWPHVYAVGNQPFFGTRDLDIEGKRVKIISVPEFSTTGIIVLVDVKTLETEIMSIEL